MTTKQAYLRGYVQRADGDVGEGPMRIVAATGGRKADGLDLKMDNVDLDRFNRNPVIMYGHRYFGREDLPIGRSDETWVDGDKLMMDVTFDQNDEFAQSVERKYRGGFLNAFSIGFDPHNIDDETGVPESWELFETSSVPLPLDPNAVVDDGRMRGLVDSLLVDARAGKMLSKKNKQLVTDAVNALQALLDAAKAAEKDDDDEPRGAVAKALDEAGLRLDPDGVVRLKASTPPEPAGQPAATPRVNKARSRLLATL